MESDQIITALKSLLSAAEREFDTKRCRHSSLKALFAARKVLRSVAAAPAVPSEAEAHAETQQELSDLRAELDEVRDERDEARDERDEVRAEVERLRAAAKDAAPAKETP